MLADERLQLSDRLVVAAEREQRVEPLLADDEPLLLQPVALGPRERLVEDVRERPSAPECERLLGEREPPFRIGRAAHLRQQPLEPRDVDRLVGDVQPEGAAAALEQPVAAERLAHARRVHVEGVRDGRRRVVAPERVDERVARHRLVPPQEKVCEQRALLPTAECRSSALDLERSEQAEVEHRVIDASTGRCRGEAPR